MKILIVDNSGPADKAFNAGLIKAVSKFIESDVIDYADIPHQSDIVNAYSGVILSGVPLHYSFGSLAERQCYFEWVTQTTLPVLGICLGHQAIGKVFGATMIKNKEAENGLCTVNVFQDDPIFENLGTIFDVPTLHRASITLPKDFLLLASTTKCKNVVMKHKNRNIYGFQFHPEISEIGETLIKNFIDIAVNQQKNQRPALSYSAFLARTRMQLQKAMSFIH